MPRTKVSVPDVAGVGPDLWSKAEVHTRYDHRRLHPQKRTSTTPLSNFAALFRNGRELTENKYSAADSGGHIYRKTVSISIRNSEAFLDFKVVALQNLANSRRNLRSSRKKSADDSRAGVGDFG